MWRRSTGRSRRRRSSARAREGLAPAGAQGGGKGDSRQVRASPAQRGDVERRRDALEAGDQDDPVLVERLVDPAGANVDDLRLAVSGVRDDPGLRPGQRDRLVAEVVDRHRRERAGDPLADRDQHVELARMRGGGDLAGKRDQLVCGLSHGGEDAHDAVPGLARGDHAPGDFLDLLGVGDRRAAELHHDRAEPLRPVVAGDLGNRFVLGGRHAGQG